MKVKTTILTIFIIILSFGKVYAINLEIDFNEVFENHGLVRLGIDVDTGFVVQGNQAAEVFYGYSREELLQLRISDINTLTFEETEKEWLSAVTEERNFFLFQHRLANGEVREVQVYSYPFQQNGKEYLYSMVIDTTSEVKMTQSLEDSRRLTLILVGCIMLLFLIGIILLYFSREKYKQFANHDPLTGAHSRLYLDRWRAGDTGLYKSNGIIRSIVMLDINKFKVINDQYGHLMGDRVLKKVVTTLKHSTRKNDFVVRYGGDEFLLILVDTMEEEAQKVMERIEEKLKNNSTFSFPIEISFGIQKIKGGESLQEAIKAADEKMYDAKRKKYNDEK